MALYRVQAIFPMFTGIPTDVITNQWHFLNNNLTIDEVADDVKDALDTFYLPIYPSSAASRVAYVDWALASYKVFNLGDPPPRVPTVRPAAWNNAGSQASTLPTEVACVGSFHAAAESGVRFQRLYNRIYLGALPNSVMTAAAVDAFPTFSGTFTTAVAGAFVTLPNATDPDAGIRWVQVSNAGGLTVARPITGGWVDNSPDSQRRRSVLASSRNPWST